MAKLRTFRTKDCNFVFNQDFAGDVHIIVPAERVEINTYGMKPEDGAVVSIAIPFEAIKGVVYHYLRTKIRDVDTEQIEATLLEAFRG